MVRLQDVFSRYSRALRAAAKLEGGGTNIVAEHSARGDTRGQQPEKEDSSMRQTNIQGAIGLEESAARIEEALEEWKAKWRDDLSSA